MTLSKRAQADGDYLRVLMQKQMDHRVSVSITGLLLKFRVRETWPMPDIESHIDIVGGAKFITVCDVQSAYRQIPIAKKDCHRTAFVTSKGNTFLKFFPSASSMHLVGCSNV